MTKNHIITLALVAACIIGIYGLNKGAIHPIPPGSVFSLDGQHEALDDEGAGASDDAPSTGSVPGSNMAGPSAGIAAGTSTASTTSPLPAASSTATGVPSASSTATSSPESRMALFIDAANAFSFEHPKEYAVTGHRGFTTEWAANATTSGLLRAIVRVPKEFQPKTNFSDAKFTVGNSSDTRSVSGCLSAPEGNILSRSDVTINGTKFVRFVTGEAGAGNFYETTTYRTVQDESSCFAVEYTIHSTNIANYPTDQGIVEYDKVKVRTELEGMAQSFRFI